MVKKTRADRTLLLTIIAAVIFVIGYLAGNAAVPTARLFNNSELKDTDLTLLREVYQKISTNHVDVTIPDKMSLVEGSVKGLVEAWGDKYTNYYSKSDWKALQTENSGQFEGIGIKLQSDTDYVAVEVPLRGSPAAKIGIQAKDLIVSVEGESMQGKSIVYVASKIRGAAGTEVKIKIYRPLTSQMHDFVVKRAAIDVDSVEFTVVDSKHAQISISKFTESSFAEFSTQWDKAVQNVLEGQYSGLVLDLRNNTGGWVEAAKYVLSEFLPKGSMVLQEQDRNSNKSFTHTDRDGKLTKIPLVVLVNEGSASASEIVAGALQDLSRAKLIGTTTVGKGVEQIAQPTSDGGMLFVVFKRWYTPNGTNLSADSALKPDKSVGLSYEDVKNNRDPQLTEAVEMLK